MNLRLENLKQQLNLEWGELAEHLGISRSMINHARKGIRSLGPKTLRRLESAEISAGLRKLPSPLDALAAQASSEGKLHLTPREYAAESSTNAAMLAEARPELQNMANQFKTVCDALTGMKGQMAALEKVVTDLQKSLAQKNGSRKH